MKILKPNLSLNLFLEQLSVSARRILLLDYDGTIAPFTEDRMMAYPYAGIEKIISKIMAIESCRVIIISGREIEPETIVTLWQKTAVQTKIGAVIQPENFIEAVRKTKHKK